MAAKRPVIYSRFSPDEALGIFKLIMAFSGQNNSLLTRSLKTSAQELKVMPLPTPK